MSSTTPDAARSHSRAAAARPGRGRLLDFWSGGWVLLLAGLLCLAIFAMWLLRIPGAKHVIGDGKDIASYGYDLSTCLVPRELLVAAGMPKDGLPALVAPEVFSRAQADEFALELRRGHQGKFLVPGDRVIGVALNGEARAYPLKLMTWHEVANDTLGGVPICVTYNPLCDSTAVFDRRVGERTLEFGVSGLVYNSNLVLYDRAEQASAVAPSEPQAPASAASASEPRAPASVSPAAPNPPSPHVESLWSQLQFRAIAGPAAEGQEELTLIPAVVVHWSDWQAAHPETTVLAPVRERLRAYKRTYESYFGSELLRFPVAPAAPTNGLKRKSPVLAVWFAEGWHVLPLARIAEEAGAGGTWSTTIDGTPLVFEHRPEPEVAWVRTPEGEIPPSVQSFWFAWYAHHPPGE